MRSCLTESTPHEHSLAVEHQESQSLSALPHLFSLPSPPRILLLSRTPPVPMIAPLASRSSWIIVYSSPLYDEASIAKPPGSLILVPTMPGSLSVVVASRPDRLGRGWCLIMLENLQLGEKMYTCSGLQNTHPGKISL